MNPNRKLATEKTCGCKPPQFQHVAAGLHKVHYATGNCKPNTAIELGALSLQAPQAARCLMLVNILL